MQILKLSAVVLLLAGLAGCAQPIRLCLDHPVVCAGAAAAATVVVIESTGGAPTP